MLGIRLREVGLPSKLRDPPIQRRSATTVPDVGPLGQPTDSPLLPTVGNDDVLPARRLLKPMTYTPPSTLIGAIYAGPMLGARGTGGPLYRQSTLLIRYPCEELHHKSGGHTTSSVEGTHRD